MSDVDALIYHVTDYHDVENHRLPFDRYDRLFFMENMTQFDVHRRKNILDTLFKACRKEAVVLASLLSELADDIAHYRLEFRHVNDGMDADK